MEDKTDFSIFSKVEAHLLKQMRRSTVQGVCRYKTECDGMVLRCAIGSLIPDDLYTEDIEGNSVVGIRTWLKSRNICSDDNFILLEFLQDIHDSFPPESWKKFFDIIRKHFDEHGRFLHQSFAQDYWLEYSRLMGPNVVPVHSYFRDKWFKV